MLLIESLIDSGIHPGHFGEIRTVQIQCETFQIPITHIQLQRITGINALLSADIQIRLQNTLPYVP